MTQIWFTLKLTLKYKVIHKVQAVILSNCIAIQQRCKNITLYSFTNMFLVNGGFFRVNAVEIIVNGYSLHPLGFIF